MRNASTAKTMVLAAAAIFAGGLFAVPQPAEANPDDVRRYLAYKQCRDDFAQSPAAAFCPGGGIRPILGGTGATDCRVFVRCTVDVPVSSGEFAYVTFTQRVEATVGSAVVDQVNLCLKPGSTQRLGVEEREGGVDGKWTSFYYRQLTNYTLHLRTGCESGETDASTAADQGLGQ